MNALCLISVLPADGERRGVVDQDSIFQAHTDGTNRYQMRLWSCV